MQEDKQLEVPLLDEGEAELVDEVHQLEMKAGPVKHTEYSVSESAGHKMILEHPSENKDKAGESKDGGFSIVKAIDFEAELETLKKSNESSRPYTLTQVEDSLFINNSTLITLEFHYYQNNCQYIKLKEIEEYIDEEDTFRDINDEVIEHHLGTHNFQSRKNEPHFPMTSFCRTKIKNYEESVLDVLQQQKLHRNSEFMRVNLPETTGTNEPKQAMGKMNQQLAKMMALQGRKVIKDVDCRMLEGHLVSYKIDAKGHMRRVGEVELAMGRNFIPSHKGNMTLTRSMDKKLVSLVNFDRDDNFGQYFKVLAFTIKLEKFELNDKLDDGLNNYYTKIKNYFDELVEVRFIGQCQYLMLTYFEKKDRGQNEILEIQEILNNECLENPKFKLEHKNAKFELLKLQRVKKYVIFDASTGKVVFTYGGTGEKQKITLRKEDLMPDSSGRSSDRKVVVHDLGVLVKEIREEQFYPQIVIFYTGDFLNERIKKSSFVFKWALQMLTIPLADLTAIESPADQVDYVQSLMYEQMVNTMNNSGDYYQYDPSQITNVPYEWQLNISISANRKLDQFSIINNMYSASARVSKTYYLNGPVFKELEEQARATGKAFDIEMPYYLKLPNEANVTHVKNSIIKDENYYDVEINGEHNIYCVRMTMALQNDRINMIKIPIEKPKGEIDVCLHRITMLGQEAKTDVYQTTHVTKVDQYAVLQTRVPCAVIGKRPNKFNLVVRKTKQGTHESADFPLLVHNLGDSKLIIDSLLRPTCNKKFILDMELGQRFVGFVNFNHYHDIGFYPKDLNLECSSRFAFITTACAPNSPVFKNKLNLLVIDPYPDKIQVAVFQSNFYYDHEIFSKNDFIKTNVVQSNMLKKNSSKFKTYMWTQFEDEICRSKLLRVNPNKTVQSEDSDENDLDKVVLEDDEKLFIEVTGRKTIQQAVFLQMDEKDYIYYVQRANGVCQLMEGNPRQPYQDQHYPIFEVKAEACTAMTVESGDRIFFMDNEYTIYVLTRESSSRQTSVLNELTIKEIQRLEIKVEPFDEIVIREKYLLYQSKIFYLFGIQEGPFPDGIFESEDLLSIQNKKEEDGDYFVEGPKLIKGSSRFFNIYTSPDGASISMRVFCLPDRTQKTLLNDIQNLVDMSSFLPDGKILVRCRDRFLLYTENAVFIDEVNFNSEGLRTRNSMALREEKGSKMNYFQFYYQEKIQEKKQEQAELLQRQYQQQKNLDFQNNEYDYKLDTYRIMGRPEIPHLLQMSQQNNYYLFYHKLSHQLVVYELVERGYVPDKDIALFQIGYKTTHKSVQYDFVLRYELDYDQAYLFQYLYQKDIDPIVYFTNNVGQIKMYNDGQVKMCYVQQINDEAAAPTGKRGWGRSKEKRDDMNLCEVVGAVFRQDPEVSTMSVIESFCQRFEFPKLAEKLFLNNIDRAIEGIDFKIKNLRLQQSRLPLELHDYTAYDNLLSDKESLFQKQGNTIFAKYFFDDLIVIYSGRYLQFGRLIPTTDKDPPVNNHLMGLKFKEVDGEVFKNINCVFSDTDEILKIIETVEKSQKMLQVIVRDDVANNIKILTWNFEANIEQNVLQLEPCALDSVGIHIVKGMNYKMNYLVNQDLIFDLEYNVPLLQQNVDQKLDTRSKSYSNQVYMVNELFNQSKIFWNGTKFLGIEKANCLFYSLNRMNIIYWRDINKLGENADVIGSTLQLEWFNLNFAGSSLFHYFAPNSEVVKLVFDQYEKCKQDFDLENMPSGVRYLPLQILNPDNEGKTALLKSIEQQSPSSFECMVQLLFEFRNICLSKLMLKSLPLVLSHESQAVINYFQERIFCPPQMQIEHFVPWNPDLEEVIFPCHTSIVWKELLLEKFAEQGIGSGVVEESKEENKQNQKDDSEKDTLSPEQKCRQFKNQLRSLELPMDILKGSGDDSQQLKRVQVQALDMDWLFHENNAKVLLQILADSANNKALLTQNIKVFIDLMWSQYQMAIIKCIFIPFVIYLSLLSYFSSTTVGVFIKSFELDMSIEENQKEFKQLKQKTFAILGVASILFLFFVGLEINSLMISGASEYFGDTWNQIDTVQIILNFALMIGFSICCVFQKEVIQVELLRTFASFATFLMWIKVFYWMRLFSAYAYYVKLIQQTLSDALLFMVMVAIIMFSFANFFLVINKNQQDVNKRIMAAKGAQESDMVAEYISDVTGNIWIDSVISVYLLGALGDFDVTAYQVGYDKYFALGMFFLATFIITVVFMNMLIAIMGETFAQVQEASVENGLREQVVLIADHLWLLDLKKIFKGQKYVFRVRPSATSGSEEDPVIGEMKELQEGLFKKIKNMDYSLNKCIYGVDLQTQHLHRRQAQTLEIIMRKIKGVEKVSNILLNGEDGELPGPAHSQLLGGAIDPTLFNKKQLELLNGLVPVTSSIRDPEYIQEVALTWLRSADRDGQGTINQQEFYDSVQRIEGPNLTDAEIRQMFKAFDINGNGQLSVEEMAQAIHKIIMGHGDENAAHDPDAYGLETDRD